MSEEQQGQDSEGGQFGGDLDEYTVGPLDDETWLVINEMLDVALIECADCFEDEYREAKDQFLQAHPDGATGSLEDWPESMKEAWNETMMGEIRDV